MIRHWESPAVLLTGASAGIGAATTRALAARGARLGLVGRRADKLETVAADCRAAGAARTEVWVQDLGDIDAAVSLADEAWSVFEGVDILINNAAIPMRRPIRSLTAADLDETMRVDFTSPARMTMALLDRWIDRGDGMVVNVSSMGGRVGIPDEAAYCAAKYALCGWSEAMAIDLHGTGVEVRLIIPGPIATDIWDRPDNEPAHYDGPLEPPETVADGILAAIEGDTLEHYLPDLKAVAEFKTADIDAYITGAVAMRDEHS